MRFALSVTLVMLAAGMPQARALELDWSGQFRSEFNWILNYNLDSDNNGGYDATRFGAGGYYIPGGGSKNSEFHSLFLRLKPKVVVNDNISIKSELWVGDPIFGFYGNAAPNTADQRYHNSTYSRGSVITAQRFWGEYGTDFGTLQFGRAPLHYGLGVVWNSGDGVWDKYQSTGDVVRLVAKFGSFTVVPAFITYSEGNSIGGSVNCDTTGGPFGCTPTGGTGALNDYSLQLKYENQDEDFEGGLNFIRRIAGASQDSAGYKGPQGGIWDPTSAPAVTPSVLGMNYNTWDIYARKRLGKLSLGGELPIVTGDVGGTEYSALAFAAEADYKASESWEFHLRGGHAPGQPNGALLKYRAFYFHPSYQLGNIMFHYQFANFAGPATQNNPAVGAQGLRSPYDNPIVNADYLAAGAIASTEKWKFNLGFVYAKAGEAAVAGQPFFNHWYRRTFTANFNQGTSLGFETDWGAAFQYDEYFQFRLDMGLWFPGDFYKFSNTAVENATSTVFATSAKIGVSF
jgi:hypothetical protein